MPLRGEEHSSDVNDTDLYFTSLAELDTWAQSPADKRNVRAYSMQARYTQRSLIKTSSFSHHRVTIPPAGWTTAAHRQGVKMLGPARTSTVHLPVSPHYARLLAHLAYQRGFDGYLLNIECALAGGREQTRALCGWIALLESELKNLVGDHAQVVWYDSVIIDGRLRWQDRLNSFNLPFFLPSSGFFTNYTWQPHYPLATAEYFLSLDPKHLTSPRPKSLKDVYVGVDVWGRGQHGGGGLACYKALEHIDPQSLGLSVALFGHAWTWETIQDSADFTWDKWWTHERTLWIGPEDPSTSVAVPSPPPGQAVDEHGSFRPISAFFPAHPPPDPATLAFFTSFSPGVGFSWFVGARKVLETAKGWTDLDKNSSLGDMLWPRPNVAWEQETGSEDQLPQVKTALDMKDAWIGGNSLKLSYHIAGSQTEHASFRCLWVPIQSLSLSPGNQYIATLVFKTPPESAGVQLDVGLSMKTLSPVSQDIQITSLDSEHVALIGGWTTLSINVCIPAGNTVCSVACGIVLGVFTEDPTQSIDFDLHLGSLAVYTTSPTNSRLTPRPKILWADFKKQSRPDKPSAICGTLTWGRGEYFDPFTSVFYAGPEDTNPAWVLGSPGPSFMYFNIYVLAHTPNALDPIDATFIGTTGLDGRQDRFYVDPACLPVSVREVTSYRFYVQGITDRGDILPWEDCVFVDVQG
ncbi:hypothetical protein EIP86_011206 [Pleurotus ostreatoroseus]|nr:hypothetical protein EIP86_011206 [Pleurotus ostreatoroseus]